MIKFPAQFHGYKKLTLGDTIISFSVDELYADRTLELAGKKIGVEFVVYLEDVTSETNLNDDKGIDEKFRAKMHGLINEYAELINVSPKEAKDLLRSELKERKLLENSTTELDIKGLAIACNILEKWIKEPAK